MQPTISEERAVPRPLPWPFRYYSWICALAGLGWLSGMFVFMYGHFTEQVNVAVYGTFMMAMFGFGAVCQLLNFQRELLERRIGELERKLEAKH